jgi:hypothetical protein
VSDSIKNWHLTPVGRIGLRDDGIVCAEITPDVEQSPETARANLEVAFRVAGNRRRPVLLDLRGALPLRDSTRKVYTSKKIGQNFLGIALVIHMDIVSRSMANLYLQVARLPIPTKIFSDYEDAISWLKKIKSN